MSLKLTEELDLEVNFPKSKKVNLTMICLICCFVTAPAT